MLLERRLCCWPLARRSGLFCTCRRLGHYSRIVHMLADQGPAIEEADQSLLLRRLISRYIAACYYLHQVRALHMRDMPSMSECSNINVWCSQGKRAALPSTSMMLRQPMQRFAQMQASDIDIYRNEIRKAKGQVVCMIIPATSHSLNERRLTSMSEILSYMLCISTSAMFGSLEVRAPAVGQNIALCWSSGSHTVQAHRTF